MDRVCLHRVRAGSYPLIVRSDCAHEYAERLGLDTSHKADDRIPPTELRKYLESRPKPPDESEKSELSLLRTRADELSKQLCEVAPKETERYEQICHAVRAQQAYPAPTSQHLFSVAQYSRCNTHLHMLLLRALCRCICCAILNSV